MPGADSLLDAIDPILLADRPEDIDLWLPSALPSTSRSAQCIGGLPRLEYRLRIAQASTALHYIRHFRRLTQIITLKSQSHITNTQKTGTRGRGVYERTKAQMSEAVATYRVSRKAIVNLAPNEEFGSWRNVVLELKNEDIHGPGVEGPKGPGPKRSRATSSRFVDSWIWTTAPHTSAPNSDDPDLDAALRVEWCKAHERVRRHEEEVELVIEEMRRTLVSFGLTASEWEERALSPSLSTLEATTAIGVAAYAYKQADMHHQLIRVFINDWYETLEKQPLAASWLSDYARPPESRRGRLPCNVRLFHSASPTPDTDIRGFDEPPPSRDEADSPNNDTD